MDETINGNVTVQADPVAAPAPQAPAATPEVLPTETRDRTREQFEKLLESNRKLFESNEALRRDLESQKQVQTNKQVQPVQQVNPNDFVEIDPISGEKLINEQRLRARLEELNTKAAKVDDLEKTLQGYVKSTESREIERQEKETFAAYPELDPRNAGFDPSFNRLVRATLTDSFYAQEDYGGRALSFKEAADIVKSQYPGLSKKKETQPTAEEQKAAEEAAAAAQSVKEQGSAQAVSQPRAQVQQEASDEEELKALQYRTRYMNDDQALAERIKHTEHIFSDVDSEA